jgi:hypothetical protein
MEIRGQLAARFEALLPHLNERQRRLLLATEARLLGHGGVRAVAQVAGVSETTIRKGLLELDAGEGPLPLGRARRPGGGRKRAEDNDPGLVPALLGLVVSAYTLICRSAYGLTCRSVRASCSVGSL